MESKISDETQILPLMLYDKMWTGGMQFIDNILSDSTGIIFQQILIHII